MSGRHDKPGERHILGISFFVGGVEEAVDKMTKGGLLVVPSAPALKELPKSAAYREALLGADMAITDSAFMVLLWSILQRERIPRVSGLLYLRALLQRPDVRQRGRTFWIMPGERSARLNLTWLGSKGIDVPTDCVYWAPIYGADIEDDALLERLRSLRPHHIIIAIGGGIQERLGLYIKRNLDYLPAIHCIGAAIAFLTGDQVKIPDWADRLWLGWLYRCVSEPRRQIPRYWSAFRLAGLMLRYRNGLPPAVN